MCFLVYLAGSPSGDRASSVGGAPRVGLESEVATSRHFSLKAYHTTSSRQRYCIIMNMNGRGSQPFHQRGSQFHRNNYGRSDVPIFRCGNDRGGGHSNQQRNYESELVHWKLSISDYFWTREYSMQCCLLVKLTSMHTLHLLLKSIRHVHVVKRQQRAVLALMWLIGRCSILSHVIDVPLSYTGMRLDT